MNWSRLILLSNQLDGIDEKPPCVGRFKVQ